MRVEVGERDIPNLNNSFVDCVLLPAVASSQVLTVVGSALVLPLVGSAQARPEVGSAQVPTVFAQLRPYLWLAHHRHYQ